MGTAQKRRGLQTKVLLGFTIALCAVAIAAIIGFTSLNRLVASIETLSAPDQKLIFLKKLLNDLSEEENIVRTYALTQDEAYLDQYRRASDSVQQKIQHLKTTAEKNTQQKSIADSIARLIDQREMVFDLFILERKPDTLTQVNNVTVIEKNIQQSLPSVSAEPTEITPPAVIADTSAVNKSKKSGNFFSRLFGTSDKNKKNKEEETVQVAIAKDSIAKDSVVSLPSTSLSEQEVKHILTRKQTELNQQLEGWTAEELLLLQQDKFVMDRIRSQINLLEQSEESIVKQQADEANTSAHKASLVITAIGALGILSTLIFIYLILIDIAKSNRLKLQLIEARHHAENLAKVKEEFLANMSHEIRTPLNSIIGFTEQLSKQKINSTYDRFIRAIKHSSDHLISIVNQILDFSKMEAGKFAGEQVIFSFNNLIREVVEIFEMRAAEKNISMSYSVDPHIPEYLYGDSVSMKQILINLVSNAIKFTDRGSIHILSSIQSSTEDIVNIQTEVKDTGVGIPATMKEHIFSAFTQADNDVARKYSGTGLGLTITKKLCDALGGTIDVSSSESTGSSFMVTIPFKSAKAPEATESNVSELEKSFLENKCVLIVDDEQMNIMLIQTILRSWGAKTEMARDGDEAIEKYRNRNFDLILLDIQMPGMSGVKVAETIRSSTDDNKKNVPIIALTANVFTELLKEKESVFNEVLLKPFKEEALLAKIKKILRVKENEMPSEPVNFDELPDAESDPPFNLKYLKRISGANREFELQMLRLFIQNNTNHIRRLNEASDARDWDAINRLAHKMVPQFRYLQIHQTEEKLKLLEELTADRKQLGKIPALVAEICSATKKVIISIEEEINSSVHEDLLQSTASDKFVNNPNQ